MNVNELHRLLANHLRDKFGFVSDASISELIEDIVQQDLFIYQGKVMPILEVQYQDSTDEHQELYVYTEPSNG